MSSAKLIVDQTTDIDDFNLSKVQDISSVAKQELDQFETTTTSIEDTYEKIKSQMLSEPEVINSTIQKVDNEFFPTIKLKEDVEEKTEQVVSINLRGKLIIGVFASIVLLLSILLIYNAVLINRYSAEVGRDSSYVLELQEQNAALESDLNSLLEGINPGAYDMTTGTYEAIELIQRTPVSEIPADTNWFDSICNFFASLFGG